MFSFFSRPSFFSASSCHVSGKCSGEMAMGLILLVFHALTHTDAQMIFLAVCVLHRLWWCSFSPTFTAHRLKLPRAVSLYYVFPWSDGDYIKIYTFIPLRNETHCTINCITNILLFSYYWYINIYMCICLNHVIILVIYITQYIMGIICPFFSGVFVWKTLFW